MCITRSITKQSMCGFNKGQGAFFCIVCLTNHPKATSVFYSTVYCQHRLCLACIQNYFQSALKDKKQASYETLPCCQPQCQGNYTCAKVVAEIFDSAKAEQWWKTALLSTCFQNKITCPFKDCKAVYDTDSNNMKQCTLGVCFECNRGFCIPCQSLWRPEKMIYRNEEEDIKKLLLHAEKSEWCRCPKCHHLVEKTGGCTTIYCMCGVYFCYKCGGYSDNHNCKNRCHEMSSDKLRQTRTLMFSPMNVKTKATY